MFLQDMLTKMKLELQDTATTKVWTDDELIRAIDKTVSLMSRLLPNRIILETQVTISVTGETLAIASSTGTLANHPVKSGTVVITGEILDTDYTINYLTGVVTEIGSLLADGNYTVAYDIDNRSLDISDLITDYIKIERIEYPLSQDPPPKPTFDQIGNILFFRGEDFSLAEDEHMRIIYTKRWTPPYDGGDGDYTENLNDPVIIGAVGQSLIFKAEYYVAQAAIALASMGAELAAISPTAPTAFSIDTVPVAPTTLDIILDEIITPTNTVFAQVQTVLDLLNTADTGDFVVAKAHLVTGEVLINTANRGLNVAENYASYSSRSTELSASRINEALARLKQVEIAIQNYGYQVQALGGSASAYSAKVGAGAQKYRAQVDYYTAMLNDGISMATQYSNQSKEYLELAGRYLASGQAKINEFLIGLGVKPELTIQKAL